MSDTQEVSAGEPWRFSAKEWNSLRRIARRAESEQIAGLSAGVPTATYLPSLEVLVYNSTASDIAAGGILAITGALAEFPTYPRQAARNPVLSGAAPTKLDDQVCVLFETIKTLEYGRAVILGAAVCTVTIATAGHRFANPLPGDTGKLKSAATGTVRILDRESSGTGDKLCIVQLQAWAVGEQMALVRCTSNTVTSGTQPGVLVEKDYAGGRSDGAAVRMKLSPAGGDQFRSGLEYKLFLNGTVTVSGTEYPLYDGTGSTAWEFPVCRGGNNQTDRAWMAEPWEIEENV